jgi:hypothetical protein
MLHRQARELQAAFQNVITVSYVSQLRRTLCKTKWQYGGRTHGVPVTIVKSRWLLLAEVIHMLFVVKEWTAIVITPKMQMYFTMNNLFRKWHVRYTCTKNQSEYTNHTGALQEQFPLYYKDIHVSKSEWVRKSICQTNDTWRRQTYPLAVQWRPFFMRIKFFFFCYLCDLSHKWIISRLFME